MVNSSYNTTIVSIIFCFAMVFSSSAQTIQKGKVMQYNEKSKKTVLSGVELNIRSAGTTVSDKNGDFTLKFLTLKPGEKVNVRRIEKSGYEIFNKEALEQWNINPADPFIIVMCRSDIFKKIRDNYEKVSSASYAKQFKKEEAALAKLKADGKLKESEYEKKLIGLRDDYEKQLDNLENYIDKFARIDLSEISAAEQKIIDLIQQGNIEEAISMYDKQNYVEKYKNETEDLRELSNSISKMEKIKEEKEQNKESLLQALYRNIDALKLAGGKDNFEKINSIYHDIVYADSTNYNLIKDYAQFLSDQHRLLDLEALLKRPLDDNVPDDIKFDILNFKGALQKEIGNYESAIGYYMKAGVIADKMNDKARNAIIFNNVGTINYEKKNFDEAFEFLRRAVQIREELAKEDSSFIFDLAVTYANIARVYEAAGNIGDAVLYFDKAINLIQNINDKNDGINNMLANNYNSIAALYHGMMDIENAQLNYKKSIDILEAVYEKNPLSTLKEYSAVLNNYAALLMDLKQFDSALEYFDKNLEVYSILKSIAPSMQKKNELNTKGNIANLYIYKGEYDKAIDTLNELIQLVEHSDPSEIGDYYYLYSTLLMNDAILLQTIGKFEEAEKIYFKALDILEEKKSDDFRLDIVYGNVLLNMGVFYSTYVIDYGKSKQYYSLCKSLFENAMQTGPQMSPYVAMCLNGLAFCEMKESNFPEALKLIEEALEINPKEINYYDTKIQILLKSGKINEATELFESLGSLFPDSDPSQLESFPMIEKHLNIDRN